MKRLTSKRNGQWTIYEGNGIRKTFTVNPLYNVFRVIDRVVIGKQTDRNSW